MLPVVQWRGGMNAEASRTIPVTVFATTGGIDESFALDATVVP
jgi:hypothetical protein